MSSARCLSLLITLLGFASSLPLGLDFSAPTTLNQLRCIQSNGYTTIMPRVYTSNGRMDNNGIQTMTLVQRYNLGLKTIPYMVPQPNVGLAVNQIDQVISSLKFHEVSFDTLYIKVSFDDNWSTDAKANVQFLVEMCKEAMKYVKTVGIYTSYGDWVSVTDNANQLLPNVALWYLSIYSPGADGESAQNFDDFLDFGPFKKEMAKIKQFGMEETVCGVAVNRDVLVA